MTTRKQAANAAIAAEFAATEHFEEVAPEEKAPKKSRFEREHDLALKAVGVQAKAQAEDKATREAEAWQKVEALDAHVADMTPAHLARSGYVSALIAAGAHQPTGSTIVNGTGPIFEAAGRDSRKGQDPRDKGQEFIGDHKSYVTLMGGNIGAVKDVLREFAQRNAAEKLIEAQAPLSNGKTQLGLSMLLDRPTVANLAALGAEYTGSFKTPLAPRAVDTKAKAAEPVVAAQPVPTAI